MDDILKKLKDKFLKIVYIDLIVYSETIEKTLKTSKKNLTFLTLILITDASAQCYHKWPKLRPRTYYLSNPSKAEQKYSTSEREMLVIVNPVDHFKEF